MRSRLLATTGALALALGGLLGTASPAAAIDHCSGWPHPDRYSQGGISFKNGAEIKAGPYWTCTVGGLGYSSHSIDVHCGVWNDSHNWWLFVRDATTGIAGWVRFDALNGPVYNVPNCYY